MTIRSSFCALALWTVASLTLIAEPQRPESSHSQTQNPLQSLSWKQGPSTVTLFGRATLGIPAGYQFLEPADAERFMELNQNLRQEEPRYLLAPEDLSWFCTFEFSEDGHVKDDGAIDASAILESVRNGTQRANEERRSRGWSTMSVVGWKVAPFYNNTSKHLEWAILGQDDSDKTEVVNFNTRLLGRTGVVSAQLVVSTEGFSSGVQEFKTAIESFDYLAGQRYLEFREGDKVATYGLAALIAGGAAAVATKTGFWKTLGVLLVGAWKMVAVGIAALFAALRKVFSKNQQQHQ